MDAFNKIPLDEASAGQERKVVELKEREAEIESRPIKISGQASGKRIKLPKALKFLGLGLAGLALFFIIILIPIFLLSRPLLVSAQETLAKAEETYEAVRNQDLITAETKLSQTHENLIKTQERYKRLAWTKFIPGLNFYYNDGEHGLNAALAGLEASQILIAAITPYADVLGFQGQGSFMGGTAEDRIVKLVQTLEKITPEIDKVADKVSLADQELSQINPGRYPLAVKEIAIRDKIISAQNTAKEADLALSDARPLIKVLPQAFGYPTTKKYLFIFQNDGELRPTGGFMTAFAVLNLDSGRVRAEKSDDIYGLDRKFGRGLAAPEPIKKYLPLVSSWHLRDMNLSPDFKVSMETFKENYDKLPGEYDVDGIVVLDTEVLKRMIEVIGPIEVPGYGQFNLEDDPRCNIPQIICELEFIVDQPLPTQAEGRKSAILGPMMQEMLLRSMGSGKNQWGNLFTTGIALLQEKHIQMYFTNEDLQKAAEVFGMAGRIKDFDGDYFHINDTNFGGAKSNLYVSQEVEQEISVDGEGKVTKKVTITYTHPEPADDCNLESGGLCLSGILRNWFRVYVPKGSRLVEALGSEVEVETNEDLGKTVFEGFFTLRPESKAKLILTYELPQKYNQGDEYKMLVQKQGGTKAWPYLVSFNGQIKEFELLTDKEIVFASK